MANILTQDIGGGSSRYPDKRSINLNIHETHTKQNVTALAVFAVFCVVLAFFTKFFVLNRIDEVNQAEAQYNALEQEVASVEQSNSSYAQVRADYSHYGNSYLNDEELAQQDRMAILDVIEKEPLKKGTVSNISISDNVAVLTMNSPNLADVSDLVANLESYDIVEYVTVATANSRDQNADTDGSGDRTVVSSMTIYFRTPADVAAAEASTETASEEGTEGSDADSAEVSSDGLSDTADESAEASGNADAADAAAGSTESGVSDDAQ